MKLQNLLLKVGTILLITSVFLVGWLSNSLYDNLNGFNLEKPLFYSLFGENKPKEALSPADRVSKDQIHVFEDKVIIDLKGATWAEFTDTNSMDPLIDAEANSFELKPSSAEDIKVGDIISYQSEYSEGVIVHRVVEIAEDGDGWYCRVKGDNLVANDPGKVRFEQIEGVLVGIIY